MRCLIEKAYEPKKVYVLRYGSDPLKTYLPDSDIDITVLAADTDQSNSALNQLKSIKA